MLSFEELFACGHRFSVPVGACRHSGGWVRKSRSGVRKGGGVGLISTDSFKSTATRERSFRVECDASSIEGEVKRWEGLVQGVKGEGTFRDVAPEPDTGSIPLHGRCDPFGSGLVRGRKVERLSQPLSQMTMFCVR